MKGSTIIPAALALAAAVLIQPVDAAQIFAITSSNGLVSFDSATPGTTTPVLLINGLQAGERLLGIDFRPLTGQLYGVGSSSRVYIVDTVTGLATAVGAPFAPLISGLNFGVDFNPTVDRLRLVSDAGQNLRLNPATGATAAIDTGLAYAPGDVNFGNSPFIVGAAYTNNFSGALTTTLYDIDSRAGVLVIQNPPNNGTLNTVGSLGVTTTGAVGFDIARADGVAFASLTVGGVSGLYRINLATGAATSLGAIGNGLAITDISVTSVPEPGSLLLGGLGLAGLLAWRRKQANSQAS